MKKWKWKIKRFFAKGRLESYFECAMAYTPDCYREMACLKMIEDYGIEQGWMIEKQRTVLEEL